MSLKTFMFVWRIEDFSYYWQKTSRIEIRSPEFEINSTIGTTKWQLVFSDRHSFDDKPIIRNKKYIILSLHRTDNNGPNLITLTIRMSFVKADKSLTYSTEKKFSIYRNNKLQFVQMTAEEILSFQSHELLPKDVLIVRCNMLDFSDLFYPAEEQCLAKTVLEVEHMYFVAVVQECDLIPGLKRSVNVKSTSAEQPKFCMNVCLSDNGKLHFEILVNTNSINLYHCKLLVLDNSSNWQKCGQDNEWRKLGEISEFSSTLNFKDVMKFQKDSITFKCEVTYSIKVEPQIFETVKYGLEVFENVLQISPSLKNLPSSETKWAGCGQSPSTLAEDLVSLYNEETLCDTKLRTEEKTFPVRKAVLSARSPVFKKMFTTDMREKNMDCVEILDINSDTVQKLLLFMYTDVVDVMDWQIAKELYFAADKYEIVSLMMKCSNFLKQNIQPSNCCELLLLSDMHHDTDLKQFVQEFILKRDQEVFGSDEWRVFVENYVQLAADTMFLKYARNK